MISLIAAASLNNVIGKNNKLPWHLPVDLKYFKNTTWGLPVIMGRKTFESTGKALPGRKNIVVTSDKNWKGENAIRANEIESAIKEAEKTFAKEIFITGGGEIFRQSMNIVDRIYITRVQTEIEGDAFFPEIDGRIFRLIQQHDEPANEKNAFGVSFQIFDKIN